MQEEAGRDDHPGGEPDGDAVDEMERESFPASDAPSTWSGRDPVNQSDVADKVAEPIPEADDPAVAQAWDNAESMDGQAPTG
jgi:hypothetical protein